MTIIHFDDEVFPDLATGVPSGGFCVLVTHRHYPLSTYLLSGLKQVPGSSCYFHCRTSGIGSFEVGSCICTPRSGFEVYKRAAEVTLFGGLSGDKAKIYTHVSTVLSIPTVEDVRL